MLNVIDVGGKQESVCITHDAELNRIDCNNSAEIDVESTTRITSDSLCKKFPFHPLFLLKISNSNFYVKYLKNPTYLLNMPTVMRPDLASIAPI